jgi:hypothetical protein
MIFMSLCHPGGLKLPHFMEMANIDRGCPMNNFECGEVRIKNIKKYKQIKKFGGKNEK